MKPFRTVLFTLFTAILFFSSIACTASTGTDAASSGQISGKAASSASDSADAAPSASSSERAVPSASSASGYPVEITDFLGYTSTVEAADRIVSLTTSSTQILMALGAEAQIVGVDAYSEPYLPGTEIVGDYSGPDVEKITALEPDLVIAANSIQGEAIDQLRSVGIPVLAAEPTTWAQVPESFSMIGAAVDNRPAAEDLSKQLEETVEAVRKAAPPEPISCYYVLSYGDAGNWTSGEGSFINTMIEYAGGAPITKDTASPWLEYPMEDLAVADPECIILGSGAGAIDDFVTTAGYRDLSAVRSGRVYEIDSDLVTIPSQTLSEGLKNISYILQTAALAQAEEAA